MRGSATLRRGLQFGAAVLAAVAVLQGQAGPGLTADAMKSMTFRTLGPSLMTGRISDIAVDPRNPSVWYVAVSSGNLWKTENRGTTWMPIFDDDGSFSLGVVTVDPKDSNVVWLGTGENNNQRSVAFGDGVYKSSDAGKTWTRTGLENSEHIQNIVIDPRNSKVVFVTAIGPLWSSGGDRGVYKTTDGGRSWKDVLSISRDTGVTDLVMDPKNPDVMYAAAYQRRRAVGQLIGGGPESGIYKTTDGGQRWTKLTEGLPTVDIGRIGLAVNWRTPRIIYALVSSQLGQGGFFRSEDAGASWARIGRMVPGKQGGRGSAAAAAAQPCSPVAPSPPGPSAGPSLPTATGGAIDDCYRSGDPGYYNEIFVDPHDPETIWSLQITVDRSTDGGRTWHTVPMPGVHVDHHDIVFDAGDRNHIILGTDGGVYETFDGMKTWRHFTNLPVSQFYRVNADSSKPFYNVCGGTQDNGTICGPSRTVNRIGIRTSDWYSVGGGDGFQARVDPEDSTIVFVQQQNGNLSRVDLRTGRSTNIRPTARNTTIDGKLPAAPQAAAARGQDSGREGRGIFGGRGQPLGRWNWDSPLIISPHNHRRLYYGGNRLYRTDDRGGTWTTVSPDLTRALDATKIEIMGKVWPTYAVAFNQATTTLSTITALDESPLLEGLIYVGTDDGLVQVTEDGGREWRTVERFRGVAERAYVTDVFASPRDVDTVFATMNNYQRGDYQPYVVKSTDRGRTWTSISSNLPERSGVWSILQDHLKADLLFAGLEFGVWFTVDGGRQWTQLKAGLPTIQARDLHIQRRDNDLIVGTFGRGIYILDDYSALRELTVAAFSEDPKLLPLRDALLFEELGQQTAAWGNVTTPNPPVGAVFTYTVGRPLPADAALALAIIDENGAHVRRLEVPGTTGLHRVPWNLRGEVAQDEGTAGPGAGNPPAPAGVQQPGGRGSSGRGGRQAPLVGPGRYRATLTREVGDEVTPLGQPQTFLVVPLNR